MTGDQTPRRRNDGADVGWAAVGYLLAGIAVWGFVGSLVDRWLDLPSGLGIMVGMVVGAAGAIYLIVKRLGA